MGKTRSPNRDKAYEIYKKHDGRINPKAIAELLGEKAVNIYSWKKNDEWDVQLKGKVGAPKGNKNAIGNKGGAPIANENALKNGKYRKYIPKTEMQVINDFKKKGATPIDLLRENIYIAQARLVSMMDIPDGNIVKTQGKGIKEYITEHEQYIDKTREFSSLLNRITKLIKEYEALTGEKYDLELEEKRMKIEKLKVEVAKADKGLDNELKIVVDYGDMDGNS